MEQHDEALELNADQLRAANAVAALKHEEPPQGLAGRTLSRIAESQPVKRVFFMLRPITHPIARVAAAALIILSIVPIADVETATALGQRIEERITGAKVTERVERIVDKLLAYQGTPSFSPHELEPFGPEERLIVPKGKRRQAAQPEA
ncbi:MAG TPA: hypothetical protein VEJ63_00735 [Planctomycetota bacterium]|nr:hypothetical protein [Planctomycetota bacterium]